MRPFQTVPKKNENEPRKFALFFTGSFYRHTPWTRTNLFLLRYKRTTIRQTHTSIRKIAMGNAQSNRNPSSVSQCCHGQTHTFSLESYVKLRRKRKTEKDDAFYESSLDLITQSLQKPIPYKGKKKRRTKWERNIKIYKQDKYNSTNNFKLNQNQNYSFSTLITFSSFSISVWISCNLLLSSFISSFNFFTTFQLANVVGAPCLIISTIVAICSRTTEICIWILTIKFSVFWYPRERMIAWIQTMLIRRDLDMDTSSRTDRGAGTSRFGHGNISVGIYDGPPKRGTSECFIPHICIPQEETQRRHCFRPYRAEDWCV